MHEGQNWYKSIVVDLLAVLVDDLNSPLKMQDMDDFFDDIGGFAASVESESPIAKVITRSSSMLFNSEPVNEPNARAFLREHSWPTGLQDAFVKGLKKIPIRFFICDDSGSMTTNDGRKFETFEDKKM